MMNLFLLDTGMKAIHYTTTLFHYDGPQIFEARDATDGHYVALSIESQNGRERYLVVGTAPEQLHQFRSGMLDLRSLLVRAGKDEWYVTTTGADPDQPIVIEPQDMPIEKSTSLPDEGFVLQYYSTDEFVHKRTLERNGFIK